MSVPQGSDPRPHGTVSGTEGPLRGVKVVELAGQGPGPFACMLLADLGAEVVRVERPDVVRYPADAHGRGRRSVALDLKDPRGRELARALVLQADVMVEGFRPGVAERLGLGPEAFTAEHPRLVYGRMTGWGQDGPLASTAGHDINYLAVAGVLSTIGGRDADPVVPLNLVGDYGGGGMLLALGVVSALLERATSGRGQVVDAAMVDGVGLLAAPFLAMRCRGTWGPRGTNLLDGGAPYYRTYRTSDHRWISVGAIEAPFYRRFVHGLGLDPDTLPDRSDRAAWPGLTDSFARAVAGRTRDEWTEVFAGVDACVAPVLEPEESVTHPHAVARATFGTGDDGVPTPAAAPRFSRTPARAGHDERPVGADTREVLAGLGVGDAQLEELVLAGVVRSCGSRPQPVTQAVPESFPPR